MDRKDKQEFFQPLFKEGKNTIIFEIGAFDGRESLEFREMFPLARIIAFEPNPECFGRISAIRDLGIDFVPMGFGSFDGILPFFTNERETGSFLLPNVECRKRLGLSTYTYKGTYIKIKITSIERFCITNQIPKIDILWIVTNGNEHDIIRGIGDIVVNFMVVRLYYEPTYLGIPLREDTIDFIKGETNFSIIKEFPKKYGGMLLCQRT